MSVIDHNRIAKNTLMLYLRMGLMMIVNLFTVRVVMEALGEVDFGIYNAVGGIVAMFSIISSTMSTACQRFYMFDLGQEDSGRLRNTFSMCLLAFGFFALVILALSESLGLWFLHNKMLLAGRDTAADWVFQCSVLAFVVGVVRLPYQGMVIAREKMKVFAYISVFEGLAALAVALLLRRSGGDHLILYAILMLGVQVLVTLLYMGYCRIFYGECRFRYYWDKARFTEIFSFAGWNLIGTSASILKIHGVNVLLNMFFGPVVNAARGVAFKVYGLITQLQENFMTASRPQIIKAYSTGEHDGMRKLVCQSSKFSAYLMLFVAVPILLEMPFLLDLWLKEVPKDTALFASLMIANALIDCLDYSLWVAIQAVGQVKKYQLTVGVLQLLILPISYAMFKLGTFPPETVFYVSIAVSLVCLVFKLGFAKSLAGLSPAMFLSRVLLPVGVVTLLSLLAGWLVRSAMETGWLRLFCVTAVTLSVQAAVIWLVGLTRGERESILKRLNLKKA